MFAAERGRLRVAAQRVDDLVRRAETGLARRLERAHEHGRRLRERLEAFRLDRQLDAMARPAVATAGAAAGALPGGRRGRGGPGSARLAAALDGLSPLAVLGRGYALVWDEAGSRLVRDAGEVEPGRSLRIRLHKGALRATVQSRESE